jgi:hypothetical protein
LIYLLVVVIAVTVLEWLIAKLPNPPVPPIAKQIAETVILILAVISVVEILTGSGSFTRIG